jgi:serine/threonine protein kinase
MVDAGARTGPYQIGAWLASGGMGVVFRARDTRLDRDLAIKRLPDGLLSDPERVTRFEREAKTLASLNHPNIAQIYGLERQDGGEGQGVITPFIVMELVDGPTLADPYRRRSPPAGRGAVNRAADR